MNESKRGLLAASAIILLLLLFPLAALAQTAAPTPDRLAAPPTVVAPTQADDGAQLYWLHCQPCHGDVGQGLTTAPDDDWRAQYPADDQYCWESGCHGERPYEDGFTLPLQIPAIIGNGSLTRFETMAEAYAFMQATMPFQAPNHLTEAEYLAIAAFLARAHNVWNGIPLTTETLSTIQLQPTYNTGTPAPPTAANGVLDNDNQATSGFRVMGWLAGGVLLVLLISGGVLWRRHGR